MAKRTKRLKTGIESLKKEIEIHLIKLEEDIKERNIELGEYHSREIENSLIKEAKHRLGILKETDPNIEAYEKELEELREKLKKLRQLN